MVISQQIIWWLPVSVHKKMSEVEIVSYYTVGNKITLEYKNMICYFLCVWRNFNTALCGTKDSIYNPVLKAQPFRFIFIQ